MRVIALSAGLACLTANTVFARTNLSLAPATATMAKIADMPGASHRHKHAHASCHVVHKHPRRHRHCHTLTRELHTRHAHHHPIHVHTRARKHSPLPAAHPLQAKGAGHTGEPTTTVTVSPTPDAATIASVLATPCENTELAPEANNLNQVQTATLCLINQERARNNELPLQANAQLAGAALLHSNDMVTGDYFAHVAPAGETPLERVQDSGYIPNSHVGYAIGENIAWGTLYLATPRSIVAAWLASPEHRANILDGDYRDSAIGIAPFAPPSLAEGQAGATYTQEFGVIQG